MVRTNAPALTPSQRAALRLAEQQGWGIAAEARDGSIVELRPGAPGRRLVIRLAPADVARKDAA